MVNPIVGLEDIRNIARLKNLKMIGGRRRIAAEDPPYISEELPPDLSGTATSQNIPIQSEDGGLDVKSYDARSNQVLTPPQPPLENPIEGTATENNGFWYNLGQSLGGILGGKLYKNLPDVPASEMFNQVKQYRQNLNNDAEIQNRQGFPEEESDSTKWNRVFGNIGNAVKESFKIPAVEMMKNTSSSQENAQPIAQNTPESEGKPALPSVETPHEKTTEENREYGTYAEPGATEKLYSNPDMASSINQTFGVQMTPEMQNQVNDIEIAIKAAVDELDGYKTRLTEHQNQLKQQIENRELSTQDKILMAIALVAPAILGGAIGGPAAFLGGISGGAQGLATALGSREEDLSRDQDKLSQISRELANAEKEKIGLQKERIDIESKINKATQDQTLKNEFNKNGVLINNKLALNAGNNLLPLKASAITSEKDISKFKQKELPKLEDELANIQEALRIENEINKIIDYGIAENEPKNMLQKIGSYIPGYKELKTGIKAVSPLLRSTYKDPETGVDVSLHDAYESYRRQLADIYSKVALKKATYTGSSEAHSTHILPNPFSKEAFYSGSSDLESNRALLMSLAKRLENQMIKDAEEKGVDTTRLAEMFRSSEINQNKTIQDQKRARAKAAVEQIKKQG